jgi:hypothetical protein
MKKFAIIPRLHLWPTWLITLCRVLIIYACIPNRIGPIIKYGLDPSWQYSLNRAFFLHRTFGTEFIFTYGPLGWLATGWSLYTSFWAVVFYKFIISLGLISLGLFGFNHAKTTLERVWVMSIILLAGRLYYYEPGIYYMMLFIALLIWHQKTGNTILLILACLWAGLNFFIKLNTGIILLLMLTIYTVVYFIEDKHRWKRVLSGLGITALLIWLIAWLTHTSLGPYLSNGWQIIQYYQDSMVVALSKIDLPGFYASLLWLGVIAMHFIQMLWLNKEKPMVWGWSIILALAFFVSFKQGFIMAVGSHPIAFYSSGLIGALIVFCWLPVRVASRWRPIFMTLSLVLLAFALVSIRIFGFANRPLKDLYISENDKLIPLSPKILATIGNSSVDFLPFENLHAFYNKLNYFPRPVPQGYQAYTSSLDSINASFFCGNSAPDFVMFGIGSVLARHPFWDELQTKFAIRNNYHVIDSTWIPARTGLPPEQNWLLRKNNHVVISRWIPLGPQLSQPLSKPIDCTVFLPDDLVSIKLSYNIKGKMKRLLFQPNLLQCELKYADGSVSRFSAIIPVLEGGVSLHCRLENIINIRKFLNRELPEPGDRLVQLRFIGDSSCFDPTLNLQVLRETLAKK